MKCPFKKKNVGLGAYSNSTEFNDWDEADCMAYNDGLRICNLYSDKRTFNVKVKNR